MSCNPLTEPSLYYVRSFHEYCDCDEVESYLAAGNLRDCLQTLNDALVSIATDLERGVKNYQEPFQR